MSEIVIFEGDAQQVEVRLEGETLWVTQAQMAELFESSTDNISLHLKNIYKDNELHESATIEEFSVVRQEGKRQVKRRLKHYNLDAIISVGYRVNSTRATRFRQWATRVLREHLTQGYSLNEHRLARRGLEELTQAVELLGKTLTRQALVTDIGREVVGLILSYAKTWRLLQDYDEGKLAVPAGARPARGVLAYDEARRALDALAEELRSRGEASELFARERGDGLAAILGNIEQTMFGEPLYKTCEERAAHLLYFVMASASAPTRSSAISSIAIPSGSRKRTARPCRSSTKAAPPKARWPTAVIWISSSRTCSRIAPRRRNWRRSRPGTPPRAMCWKRQS